MIKNPTDSSQPMPCPHPGTKAWILAAGRATRNKTKLSTTFCGLTLPEHAAVFAEKNGYEPEIITTQTLPGTAGALDGRTGLVLFGDNYYHGSFCIERAAFTYSWRDCQGLAVVCGNKIIEKPHAFKGLQMSFTGLCFVDRWIPLDLSARGEYEITDLLNGIDAVPTPMVFAWEHFSYPSDYERVLNYVRDHQD